MSIIFLAAGLTNQLYLPAIKNAKDESIIKNISVQIALKNSSQTVRKLISGAHFNPKSQSSAKSGQRVLITFANLGGLPLDYTSGSLWNYCDLIVRTKSGQRASLTIFGENYFKIAKAFPGKAISESLLPGEVQVFSFNIPFAKIFKGLGEGSTAQIEYFLSDFHPSQNSPHLFTNTIEIAAKQP